MHYLHKGFLEHGVAADWITQAHTHARADSPTHPNHTALLGWSTQAGPALANPITLLAMPTQKLP